jgi:Tat protein secretion system quality control protein TatD with DNase activity
MKIADLQWFDSHVHLEGLNPSGDLHKSNGLVVSIQQEEWSKLVDYWNQIHAFQANNAIAFGMHPWKALEKFPKQQLEILLQQFPYAWIGEIGLDRRISIPWDWQIHCFEEQLKLARDWNRPVSIHCVQSHGAVLEQLFKFPTVKGIIHGFYGSAELVREYRSRGFYIGLGPRALRQLPPKQVPFWRALVPTDVFFESDAPGVIPNNGELGLVITQWLERLEWTEDQTLACYAFQQETLKKWGLILEG